MNRQTSHTLQTANARTLVAIERFLRTVQTLSQKPRLKFTPIVVPPSWTNYSGPTSAP
jgi:hypothetical protein